MTARRGRRGFVLLFALAILVLLSVFAVSFASLTRLERLAATNVRLQVQAAALAEAGVAQACAEARTAARLRTWVEPSDWWANGTVQPAQSTAPGAPVEGIVLGQNAYGGLDRVQVLSFDTASKLDVNLRTPGLARALEIVGVPPADVTALLDARDAAGGALSSRDELRRVLGDALFETVRDFITVHGTPRVRPARSRTGDLPWTYAVPGTNESPVDVNGASERVLAAALANIEGRPIEVETEPVSEWLNRPEFSAGRGFVTTGGLIRITEGMAADLATEIVRCRARQSGAVDYASRPFGGPFTSWEQFDDFLAALEGRVAGFGPPEHALLLAAASPDARFMGYNPDRSRRTGGRMVDRLCVTRATTGLSLGGSGVLEVRATGWITDRDSAPDGWVAQATLDRVVRVFTPVHVTSQADLEAAWDPGTSERGLYQTLPEHVSVAPDPLDGHLRLTTESLVAGGTAAFSTAFRGRTDPGGPYAFTRASARGEPLRERGVIAPDGFLVFRRDRIPDNARMACPADLPSSMAQEGSAGFWVKLWGDQTSGTDEALLVITIDDSASWQGQLGQALAATIDPPFVQPARTGASIKVERFRGRLRATWWYWGVGPEGAISRFVLTLSEVQKDISSWRPGEWHHVMVSWRNTPQDWGGAAAGNPLTLADVPNDGISLAIDGSTTDPIAEEMFNYSSMLPNGVNSVAYNCGRIASVPAEEGIIVGGYTLAAAPGVDVHSTGVTPSQLQRFTNATIDDVYVDPSPGGVPSYLREQRFEQNPGLDVASFDLPVGSAYHEVGAISAEIELPPGCSAVVRGAASRTARPFNLAASELGPIGGAGNRRTVRVRVGLSGPGTRTPVLEGFTILLLPPIELIEELRDPP